MAATTNQSPEAFSSNPGCGWAHAVSRIRSAHVFNGLGPGVMELPVSDRTVGRKEGILDVRAGAGVQEAHRDEQSATAYPSAVRPCRTANVMVILLAVDHAVVRRGLMQILMDAFPTAAFLEAANAAEVLRLLSGSACDLLVLDVTMPDRSGVDVLRDVRRLSPRLPILVISVHPEDQYAVRALRAGASGFLNKDTAPEELVLAAKKVLTGGRYVSARLAEKLATELHLDAGKARHDLLSDREFEVLRMIASGKMVSAIADELHLSVTTVSTYRARILEKMNMTTTAELMQYGLRNHLVD
jgi:two-component system invasion response regulator UvrY